MNGRYLVLIASGSAIGACLRYSVDFMIGMTAFAPFPLSTFLINLFGSFLIGYLAGKWSHAAGAQEDPGRKLFWITGICGGFTTFSAFSHQLLEMILGGHGYFAGLYAAGSVGLGIFAVWAGASLSICLNPSTNNED